MMMNLKNILFGAMLLVAASSCQKQEEKLVFGETPDVRMKAKIDSINNALTTAPNGWKVTVGTGLKGGYGFYMAFDDQQVVKMVADLTDASATKIEGSNYRIKQDNGATLIFDTYNYISMLNDPNPSVYNGTIREGLRSDLEYRFLRSNADSIIFVGKRYSQQLVLAKATAAEKEAYNTGAYKTGIDKTKIIFQSFKNPYIEVNIGGVATKLALSIFSGTKTLDIGSVLPDNKTVLNTFKFAFNLKGFDILAGGNHRDLVFTKGEVEGNSIFIHDIAGNKYEIKNSANPILPIEVMFSFDGAFNAITIAGTKQPEGVSSSFNSIWTALVNFHAANGMVTHSVNFRLSTSKVAVLDVRFQSGSTVYLASAEYNYTLTDGVLKLTAPIATNGNWNNGWVSTAVRNYFSGGEFKLTYISGSDPNAGTLGGLIKVSDPAAIFYGKLSKL